MAKIDNKSASLREVFKRVHLAGSEEERKQAMELMSDLSGFSLQEQENHYKKPYNFIHFSLHFIYAMISSIQTIIF